MPHNFYWNKAQTWFDMSKEHYRFYETCSWYFLLLWARNSNKEK